MRELCSYGSVGVPPGNRRPYPESRSERAGEGKTLEYIRPFHLLTARGSPCGNLPEQAPAIASELPLGWRGCFEVLCQTSI
jgi:hypothetical protein